MDRKFLHHPLCHIALILLLGTLAYANSFGVPFVFDDLEGIAGNEIIRDLGNFLPGGAGYGYSRRWVGIFTFALNYRFGGFAVSGYHLFNLSVHLGTALLVYALLCLTFRTPFLSGSRLAPQAGMAALLAALFFVVHPIQTQAVTYIVQRLTSLCTFFYLLSLVLYAWGRLRQEESGHGSRITDHGSRLPQHLLLFTASVLAALLAMFTKEIAFTLPIAALLFEACFFAGPWRRRILAALPLLLTLPIIPILLFAGGEMSAAGTILHARIDIPRSHYLLTQFPVIATYLRLLVLPIGQNVDYDYPIYTTFFTPPVFLSLLLLASIFAMTLYLFWRTRSANTDPSLGSLRITDHASDSSLLTPHPSLLADDPSARLIAFGIFWFFLTLSVESSFIPLSDVIFEHRLYLPSIGMAMAFAVAVLLASQQTTAWFGGSLPLLAAALAIVALTAGTWHRNQVWQSEISLWEDVTRKSPGKARPWYNLGTYLKDSGRPAEAVSPLLKSVALDSQYAEAWHNLGLAYLMTGRNTEALEPLRMAVQLKPEMDNATVNYAVALILAKKPGEAAALLERNLHRFPAWAEARLNLGIAYLEAGNRPAAKRELATLRRLDPAMASRLAGQIRQSGADPSQ